MIHAGARRPGRPPGPEAPAEQVEQERPADPTVTEGIGGPRGDPSAAPQATPPRPTRRLRGLLAAPGGLRQAILAAEVLGPPAAVRRAGRARRR